MAGQPILHVKLASDYMCYMGVMWGPGDGNRCTFFRRWEIPGWFIVGDYCQPGGGGTATGMTYVVQAENDDPNYPLLKAPVGYAPVWKDIDDGSSCRGSIWYPVPPQGYISLGYIASLCDDRPPDAAPPVPGLPSISNYRCIREDQCTPAKIGQQIFQLYSKQMDKTAALYQIEGSADLFYAQANHEPPVGTVFVPKNAPGS